MFAFVIVWICFALLFPFLVQVHPLQMVTHWKILASLLPDSHCRMLLLELVGNECWLPFELGKVEYGLRKHYTTDIDSLKVIIPLPRTRWLYTSPCYNFTRCYLFYRFDGHYPQLICYLSTAQSVLQSLLIILIIPNVGDLLHLSCYAAGVGLPLV